MYKLQFRCYQRSFLKPLTTHHGTWKIREGIIIQLQDQKGRSGWGEIAPIPWFNTETLADAVQLCQQLGTTVRDEDIKQIPNTFPASQFAFATAVTSLAITQPPPQLPIAALLPTGSAALAAWSEPWQQGKRTFKWKIAVDSLEREIKLFEQLLAALPPTAKLRLDANGGLTPKTAQTWLNCLETTKKVEFLEQPLPPAEFETMRQLQAQYTTPLALDESVTTIAQLQDCYHRGWRGIFIVKIAIAGFPQRLRQFCQNHSLNLVFSSVFETEIARNAAFHLAAELASPQYALGFGTEDWLEEYSPKKSTPPKESAFF
ncbi:MAG: o-succinylbenzoate synthase [Jaaginema sp. PMC 1079.18]|nr:o-succinylbenzoate synthase [Jaaginema sp. PMC 1080.18]MEC4853163.1 o-succinylbenzoate synthase [Jaaginema sp. PMC 1079.18]MEC4868619.1 o-succinylbenzoate synthase [Jaaginema sp. PMC 1078.18]